MFLCASGLLAVPAGCAVLGLPPFLWTHESIIAATSAALLIALLVWWITRRRYQRTWNELTRAVEVARQREWERDLVQEELARRLSQERELAREKAQFQAQLAEYEKYAALAQLAMGAAHEINNPLLGIFSHLELELRAVEDPEQRAEIEQCLEGAKRISATIHGLLNYARPGPLLISKIHLDRLVEDTFAFLRHQPLFHGIELGKDIPADLPQISADANQLSQVLMNLLLNAGQATDEGGRITVTARKVKFQEQVEIAVADTGCGIPADLLSRVTEPFFTTKRGKGTGLGLAAVRLLLHTIDLDPQFSEAHRTLAVALVGQRKFADALAEARKALALNPNNVGARATLGYVEAVSGDRPHAIATLQELQRRGQRPPWFFESWVLVGLGERDQALDLLEREYNARSPLMVAIALEPILAPLRDHPRFIQLQQDIRKGG